MVDCDPGDARVGSGGGTAWMLYRTWKQETPETCFGKWLASGKRIILPLEIEEGVEKLYQWYLDQ
jgi:hypothetical protein